jgi:hypothetical protein
MAKFFASNEFPSFKPIKAGCDKIAPLLDTKILGLEAAVASAMGDQKEKFQKDLNYLKGLKEHCILNPGKPVYFTKEQATLVGIL